MAIKHSKTSAVADGPDASLVRPSDWNASHVLDAESANKVLAGPASGAQAAPTFRSLVGADLPVLNIYSHGRRGSTNWTLGANNQVRISGFVLPYAVTFSRILVSVTVADAGASKYSVGIYDSAGTLKASIPAQTFPSVAVVDAAISQGTITLPPGRYYLAFTGEATVASIDSGGTFGFTFLSNQLVSESSTNGALPASITVPADAWTSSGLALYFALR